MWRFSKIFLKQMWRFIIQAILHLPISLICIYSEQVLFEVPNFQSCNLKMKFQILNFFVHGFFFFNRGIIIFEFNYIYKMEDILNLGLYRIFSKNQNQLVPRLGKHKNTWTLQNHPTSKKWKKYSKPSRYIQCISYNQKKVFRR
jgi:hypothetical protein